MMKRGDIVRFCKAYEYFDLVGGSFTIPRDTKVVFLSQGIDTKTGNIIANVDHGGIYLIDIPIDYLTETHTAPKDRIWEAVKSCATGTFCRV